MSTNRLLVFDLDGTLVDSSRDLAAATNAALQRVAPERTPIPLEKIRAFVGEGARVLIERSLRHSGIERPVDEVLPLFLECYAECLLDTTRLYPGILDALEKLDGATLAVLTNKPGDMSRTILEGLGVLSHFARVWGPGEAPERKPHPSGLLGLIAELGARRADTWMIGDSPVDARTARAAGVRMAGVTWGLHPEGLRRERPDLLVEDPADLVALATE
jgi:phosphoglycolate phosphatase